MLYLVRSLRSLYSTFYKLLWVLLMLFALGNGSESTKKSFLADKWKEEKRSVAQNTRTVDPRLRGGQLNPEQLFLIFPDDEKNVDKNSFEEDAESSRKFLLEQEVEDHLNSSKEAFYKSREKIQKDVLPIISADGESDFLPFAAEGDGAKVHSDSEKSSQQEKKLPTEPVVSETTEKKENDGDDGKAEGKHDEVGEIIDHILDKLDDEEDKGAGKFNETIEKQEGTLEWVARVGKHHHKSDAEGKKGGTNSTMKQDEELKKDPAESVKETGKENQQVEGEEKKESSLLDMVLGAGGKKKKESEKRPPSPRNETLINGQSSSAYLSEGQVKEMAEVQAKAKADKEQDEKSEEIEDVPRLIDSNDNEYVISNPGKGSKMQLQEDFTLISDIVKVIVSAALGALVCGFLGQPLILGYLVAGMIVGPGGFRFIHELVQVETLAQFGVVFLLFALGIEFNLSKMQGCQAVALGGGAIQIVISMFVGAVFNTVTTQGIFIGAFLSMSSTAVVLKCLMDANLGGTEHGQIMLGTLILQDCALGLLLAVLPALSSPHTSAFSILHTIIHALSLLAAFCACAFLLAKLAVPRFLHHLMRLSKYSAELYQLGCVGLCLCVALISESLGLSLEVGAFVAGLMLSGGKYSERTLHQIEPIRNIFAALFLTSIGMVMNPEFLWKHIFILLSSLAVVFFGKAILIASTVRLFGYSGSTAISVGIALSQIGEFSFVLLSRAQTLNLVSHKVYLLLMGTTALSLVLTPFSFKLVIWIITNEEKLKHRGKLLFSMAGGHPPSDNESLVSPHVMTSHRDNDNMRFRLKPLGIHEDDREAGFYDTEGGGANIKLSNGTKTHNQKRNSPRTPNGSKSLPTISGNRVTPEEVAKVEKEPRFPSPGQSTSSHSGHLGNWKNSQENVAPFAS